MIFFVTSQILRKMSIQTLILGPSCKVNFVLFLVFWFVSVKCSILKLKLSTISRLRWLQFFG